MVTITVNVVTNLLFLDQILASLNNKSTLFKDQMTFCSVLIDDRIAVDLPVESTRNIKS